MGESGSEKRGFWKNPTEPLDREFMPDFGEVWARSKLDMSRRRVELTAHIAQWLPELRTMQKGTVIDLGAGPGDFLALCSDMGHDVFGVDAPQGRGGMGDAYLEICREERKRLGVHVDEIGALRWIEMVLMENMPRQAVCVHSRGAIEQMFANVMLGEPHDSHHECKRLDWDIDAAPDCFRRLMRACAKVLRPGGIVLIAANGTKSTDVFYERAIQEAASKAGLRMVGHRPPLLHKWLKVE